MKLKEICESIVDKQVRQFRERIRSAFPFVPDVEALIKHIVSGCNSTTLLIDNDKWWENIVPLLEPIPPAEIEKAQGQATADITAILNDPEKRSLLYKETPTEGILSGAWNILKSIVTYLIKTAAAGVGAGLAIAGAFGGGHGGYGGGRAGAGGGQVNQNVFLGNVNVQIVASFFQALEPAAAAIPKPEAKPEPAPTPSPTPAPGTPAPAAPAAPAAGGAAPAGGSGAAPAAGSP